MTNNTYLNFSSAIYSVFEKDHPYPNQIGITVERSGNIDVSSSVEVHLGNTSAQEGIDFAGMFPYLLNFEPGETSKEIYLDIFDDYEIEGTENIELKLITDGTDPYLILGAQNKTTVSVLDNETAYIEFGETKYITTEGNYPDQLEVTLIRSGELYNYADVQVLLAGGSATEGLDFNSPLPEFASFNPGETTKTITINITDDFDLEGTETIQLELWKDPYNEQVELGEKAQTTVSILDNETSYLEFAAAKYITSEDSQTPINQLAITVNRSGNINSFANAEIQLGNGTATEGLDFYLVDPWIFFNPGETSKTFFIDINDDPELEGTETIDLQLVPEFGDDTVAIGEQATTTVSLLDNDVSYVQFAQANYSGLELDNPFPNQVEITLTRTGNVDSFVEVELQLGNGSAQLYQDFDSPFGFPQLVAFNPGETSKTITIDIWNDGYVEGTETIDFQLTNPFNNAELVIGEQGSTTLSILDAQTAYIEFGETKYITTEGNYPDQLEVTLIRSGELYNYADVQVLLAGGSATEGLDFSSFLPEWVTFNPGETSQTITLNITDDFDLEGTETIQLELWKDPYNEQVELGEKAQTTVSILDNETSYLEFAAAKYITSEDSQTPINQLAITVNRSGNINSFANAEIQLGNGTATEGLDFYLVDPWIFFNPGETSKTFFIDINDDPELEGTETIDLQLVPEFGDDTVAIGEQATTTVSLLDNDVSYIQFSSENYSGFEKQNPNFNSVEITLLRTGDITHHTSIELYLDDGNAQQGWDFDSPLGFPQWVNFAAGETSKTVTIEIFDDSELEGTETIGLKLISDPNKVEVRAGEQDTATLSIFDDETSRIEFSQIAYSILEDDPNNPNNQIAISLRRFGPLNDYADVEIYQSGGSAQLNFDFQLPFEPISFAPGETNKIVYLDVLSDSLKEGTETVELGLRPLPYSINNVGEQNTTMVTIFDDETTYVEFGAVSYSVNEDQGLTMVVELMRTGDLSFSSDVHLNATGRTAIEGNDYFFNNLIHFAAFETSKLVEIDLLNDPEIEPTETIDLEILPGMGSDNYVIGAQNTTTVDIIDSSPIVEFGAVSYSVNEDQGLTMVVELMRTGDLSFSSDVHLNAAGGTAIEGNDYFFNNLIHFAAFETSKLVEIDLLNNPEIEGIETIDLEILPGMGSDNYVIGAQNTTTVDIIDSSPTVEFGAVSYSVNEDQGLTMVVELMRTGDLSFSSDVHLNATGGTAIEGNDYFFNNLIHFAAFETSKLVEIDLLNDPEIEGIETIDLEILPGMGSDNYVIGTQNTTTVDIIDNDAIIAEMGKITDLTHVSQTISLNHNFINPVIFAQPLSRNGGDPSTLRITDIQSNSFSVQVQEPTLINGASHSGSHTTESFSFLVVEKGIWTLSDGSILEVGSIETDAITKSTWEGINFNNTFTSTPVTLSQVQTDNDATFVRTRQRNATLNGFELALEEEEALSTTGHGSETIAWLAISPGQGNWDGNAFVAGNTGDQVTHNWFNLDFGNNFTTAPQFLGNIATYDGPDSSGLRYQNLTNGQVQIMIEEDTSNDSEVSHTTEDVNFLAIEGTGILSASSDSLTGLVETQNGTINADLFVLGDSNQAFYDTYGQQDYGDISGFDASQDTIQLHGVAADYYIGASPSGNNDQGIFLQVAGMEDELVGIVKETTGLDINSNAFVFV